MTNDSNLFHTTKVGYPLYEGKMIYQFEHSYEKPRYWIEESEGRAALEKKERNRTKKINKNIAIRPRIDCDEYRLVWRSITNSTNERTMISTILPPSLFLGNSLNYLSTLKFNGEKYIRTISLTETVFLCGIFNSFPIDFILRHKVATNLNIFYLMEMPIPRFNENNKLHDTILKNSSKLICDKEYAELYKSMKIKDFITEPEERIVLEAEVNACVAKIYDLTQDDLKQILENFPLVNKKLKELTLDELVKLK